MATASGESKRGRYQFSRARRLRTAAEFSAVLGAPKARAIRAEQPLLSVVAAVREYEPSDGASAARFGVTVGRRNARRAVDRALIKRIVREACRHHAAAFEDQATHGAVQIDVVLRLKSPLVDAEGQPLAMRRWRRQLRLEADALLNNVLTQLTMRAASG